MDLTDGQIAVLSAFKDAGAIEDQVLAALVHHRTFMSSSSIRSRRAELVRKGALEVVGTKKLRSGRSAAVHAITRQGKAALRKSKVAT